MKNKNAIRVILADDHAVIRRGIRRILEKSSNILVIAEASTGADAIHLVKELKPDVLVLDIEMPDMKGDAVARELRKTRFPVAILILSAFSDQAFIDEVMHIGVDAYLSKDESPDRIRAAVRDVSEKHDLDTCPAVLLFYATMLLNLSKLFDTFGLTSATDIPRFFS